MSIGGTGGGFRPRRWLIGAVLALPFLALLWVPSYASVEPSVAGIPFFYWYQLLWVFLGSGCIGTALWLKRDLG